MTVYPAIVLFEVGVNVKGSFYLVIYGKHANGYFCCIPNWGVGCEMAEPSDTFYNTERLVCACFHKDTAKELAKTIKNVFKELKQ